MYWKTIKEDVYREDYETGLLLDYLPAPEEKSGVPISGTKVIEHDLSVGTLTPHSTLPVKLSRLQIVAPWMLTTEGIARYVDTARNTLYLACPYYDYYHKENILAREASAVLLKLGVRRGSMEKHVVQITAHTDSRVVIVLVINYFK